MEKIAVNYKKACDFMDKIVLIIGGVGLLICVGMCAANILMWWFMGKRIAVCDEISLFGLIWATYIGMGILYRQDGHCVMDFVPKAMPLKAQAVLRVFTDIVILVTCLLTVKYSWALAAKSFTKKLVLTRIPYFYVDISITIGYAHMLLLSVGSIISGIYKLTHWGKE